MRSIFNFLALALLVVDGTHSHPTPATGISDDLMVKHATEAANRVMQDWDKNHHYLSKRSENEHNLSKRINWGALASTAGSILGSLFKRDEVLPDVQLDKRGLSFLKSHEVSKERRGLSFLQKHTKTNSMQTKRDVQIGDHHVDASGAEMLKVVVNGVAASTNNDAEMKEKISDNAERVGGETNPDQSKDDQAYFAAAGDIQDASNRAAIKSEQELDKTLSPQSKRLRLRREVGLEPSAQTIKDATDDHAKAQAVVEAAATQMVTDDNQGHSISTTERNRQVAQTSSVLATAMQGKIDEALSRSNQPVDEALVEQADKAEGNPPSSTSTSTATHVHLAALSTDAP